MAHPLAESDIHLKRAYEWPSSSDGVRILVDRLWPRGVTKERAAIDQWMKEVAPSTELRRWFGHDPKRWGEFRRRYRIELSHHQELLNALRATARKRPLNLVYAARDREHNEAIVLREVLIISVGATAHRQGAIEMDGRNRPRSANARRPPADCGSEARI